MIPNVIVTPPDEESAPYLCFDSVKSARKVLSNPPDPTSIHTALAQMQDQTTTPPPVFHRNSLTQEDLVMPRKSHRKPAPKEPENDSDVVEVIKVRKRVESPPPDDMGERKAPQGKPSTLKSRASKAFMSLKTIGKSTGTSKPHVADVFAASEIAAPEEEEAATPTVTRSTSKRLRRPKSMIMEDTTLAAQPVTLGRRASQLARRSSVNLSNLFNTPKDATPDKAKIGPPRDESFTVLPAADESIGPDVPLGAPLTRCRSASDPSGPVPAPPPVAPTRPSNSRKFSMNSLGRFFSFSNLPPAAAATPPPGSASRTATSVSQPRASVSSTRSDETESGECILPPELSSSPPPSRNGQDRLPYRIPPPLDLGLSTSDGSEDDCVPITPTDERPRPSFSSQTTARKSYASDKARKSYASETARKSFGTEPRVSHDLDADTSVEMRLDSLHFDELSFDLERF